MKANTSSADCQRHSLVSNIERPLSSVVTVGFGSQSAAETLYSLIQRGTPTIEWFKATAISSA